MADNNKVTLDYKIKGVVSSYEYSTSPFDKEGAKPMHRVGIKFNEGERDELKAFCDKYAIYKNTSNDFKPSWYKPREGHEKDTQYINLKSNYPITVYYAVDSQDEEGIVKQLDNGKYLVESTLDKLVANKGSVGGSEVIVRLSVKEGAIYPLAISFKSLKVRTFEDMFDNEDLPFN